MTINNNTRAISKNHPLGKPVFELRDVDYKYNGLTALKNITFSVFPGESVAFLGANGSGKSTLLKLLDALYLPIHGNLNAFGIKIDGQFLNDETAVYNFRRKVGLVFQDPDVQLFSPTVWDEVAFAPLHLGLPRQEVILRCHRVLSFLGIEKLKDRPPHLLSGGEMKKVALASILSLDPDVWLFDEPTASLDPKSQSVLLDFISELAGRGKTVITATHDLASIAEIADRVIVLSENHTLVAEGKPQEILTDDGLLVANNLIHEHHHRHGKTPHRHPHIHTLTHHHSK